VSIRGSIAVSWFNHEPHEIAEKDNNSPLLSGFRSQVSGFDCCVEFTLADAGGADNASLRGGTGSLRRDNKSLRGRNELLRTDNGRLRGDNRSLRARNQRLWADNDLLRTRNDPSPSRTGSSGEEPAASLVAVLALRKPRRRAQRQAAESFVRPTA